MVFLQKKFELLLKSESSKAVRRKVQNIDIGSGFQGSADENDTGSNVDDVTDLLMDQRVKEKKFKNQILEDDDDSDFTDMPDFSAVETNVTVQPSSPAEEPEPIKQFKMISHKKEGNYHILV